VRADRNDQLGTLVISKQHRHVLAGACRWKDHRVKAELADTVQAGRPAVPIRVHDDLRPAPESCVRDRVHVSDDEVRTMPSLEQRVGPTVDADQDGPILTDIGPQRLQVVLVVIAPNHHEGVTAVQHRGDVGNPHAIEQQLAFAPEVLHRVGRERLELDRKPCPCVGHGGSDHVVVEKAALGHDHLTHVEGASVKTGALPVPQLEHHVLADVVDQRHACVHQDLWPKVRVAPGDRRRGVDHRHRLAGEQSLSADLVEVLMVDDRNVAGLEPLGQLLGAPVNAHSPPDTGQVRFVRGTSAQGLEHRRPSCHVRGHVPPTHTCN